MNLKALKAGTKLLLEDGSAVEVLAPSVDGLSIHVCYLDSPFSPELVGTESDCTDYEISGETNDEGTDTPVRFA
ncbi:MAG TPA: hypothetical protein VK821_18790 [Dehalococcoidia bacterium]|nr:hypothetical protein [Dehalococcoidia bacterium]